MRFAVINARYPLDEEADSIVFSREHGILYAGGEAGVERFKPLKIIDADQHLVVPGLADAHTHLYSTALTFRNLDLRGVASIDELKERVRKTVESVGRGEWIVGRGWDQDKMAEKRYPTRHDLDEVAPDNPVVLVRVCGHAALLNTEAIRILGLMNKKQGWEKFIQIEDGKPTGIIFEDMVGYVLSRVPPPPVEKVEETVRRLLKEYLSYGVTTLHSMSVAESELEIISRIISSGEFIHEYRAYIDYEEFLKGTHNKYPELTRGVKIFSDGSFGARTAALRENYADAPVQGQLLLDSEKILGIASEVVSKGLDLAVHAIGDKAVQEVLKTAHRLKNLLRIEHASLTPPDLIEEIALTRPRISVQPHFILSDTWIIDRLGSRALWTYAYRSLIYSGAALMGSSDSPVEPINPWLGIYAATTRGENEQLPFYRYTWFEKLSFREAVKLYSENTVKGRSLVILNTRRVPESLEEHRKIRATTILTSRGIEYLRTSQA
ncbi:MAG: amidohydrolase [Infirmifilum sp.]